MFGHVDVNLYNVLPNYGRLLVHSAYIAAIYTCHCSVNTVPYTKINDITMRYYYSTKYLLVGCDQTNIGETVSRVEVFNLGYAYPRG
jgi:hypothetical protein